jgi:hypothetical protein
MMIGSMVRHIFHFGAVFSFLLFICTPLSAKQAMSESNSSRDITTKGIGLNVEQDYQMRILDQMSHRIDDFRIAHAETEERINSESEKLLHILIAVIGIFSGGITYLYLSFEKRVTAKIDTVLGSEFVQRWHEVRPQVETLISDGIRLDLMARLSTSFFGALSLGVKNMKSLADVKLEIASAYVSLDLCRKLCSNVRADIEEAVSRIESGDLESVVKHVPVFFSLLPSVASIHTINHPDMATKIREISRGFEE